MQMDRGGNKGDCLLEAAVGKMMYWSGQVVTVRDKMYIDVE